jgi:hypothetical protein
VVGVVGEVGEVGEEDGGAKNAEASPLVDTNV